MLVARMRWIESQVSQNFGNADSAEARMRVDGTESNSEELATGYTYGDDCELSGRGAHEHGYAW
jgi:hypothetical protein